MKRLVTIVAASSLAACTVGATPPASVDGVEQAIDRAVGFVIADQMPHGEFRTLACLERELERCRFESSPFVTAFVLHALSRVEDARTQGPIRRALDFLVAEQGPAGAWRYYGSRDGKVIPADLDDTAVVSFALRQARRPFEANEAVFAANRREDGVYRTWVPDESSPEAKRIYEALAGEVDPAVNANVLLYRGRTAGEAGACAYVNERIASGESRSDWYEDRLAIFYMVARAAAHGASCLEASRDTLVRATLARRLPDGSFGGPLETALAVSTLAYARHAGPERAAGIAALLASQRPDGSWPRSAFFRGPTTFYGSEVATTAFALEALAGYLAAAPAPQATR